MPEGKVRTRARVRISLEIYLPDVWGGDCPLRQVYRQSADSAKNIISQKIISSMEDVRMIGEPEIEAILVRE